MHSCYLTNLNKIYFIKQYLCIPIKTKGDFPNKILKYERQNNFRSCKLLHSIENYIHNKELTLQYRDTQSERTKRQCKGERKLFTAHSFHLTNTRTHLKAFTWLIARIEGTQRKAGNSKSCQDSIVPSLLRLLLLTNTRAFHSFMILCILRMPTVTQANCLHHKRDTHFALPHCGDSVEWLGRQRTHFTLLLPNLRAGGNYTTSSRRKWPLPAVSQMCGLMRHESQYCKCCRCSSFKTLALALANKQTPLQLNASIVVVQYVTEKHVLDKRS